jgi:alkyl sulfatase BDS1-like metallo-beta-lactamase superfamily hydrolase
MRGIRLSALLLIAVVAGGLGSAATGQEPGHFSPKGKMPSKYTVEAQEQQRKILPFADKRDFEEAKRGFIAAPPYRKIMTDKGGVAWDIDNWNFRPKSFWTMILS